MQIPQLGQPLRTEHLDFLNAFSKSCRRSILQMTANAQSGHPGGSCSSIDYLALLYTFIIGQSGEDVVVSNGHISPAVYSVLAEMGYIPKKDVVEGFRKFGSVYEGHITRHVRGIPYGTGPLGIGVSVASGFALAEKLKETGKKVFSLVGDGESEEGQVYEMMNFASKYKLKNYIVFMDRNRVQLSDSLAKIMPIRPPALWEAAGWNAIEVDGHDYSALWAALHQAHQSERPTILIGRTVMGKGVSFMEADGMADKATWHGVAPKPEQAEKELAGPLAMTDEENALLEDFRRNKVKWQPPEPQHTEALSKIEGFDSGAPMILPAGSSADCRSAYGKALKDLADRNPSILAMTADVSGSVKTDLLAAAHPDRHFDAGIAEQHMVSLAGGLSLKGYVPFASAFGAFMTSRAKDQARVNDINRTNVKMVATHCGLSVGEDGPTHQSIDDLGSFLGFFNTHLLEPADANQTDFIIRFVASHYGNFYVRMGRHKLPVILKENGTPFYDENYRFEYGKADLLRQGDKVTLISSGSTTSLAVQAADQLKGQVSVEVINVSAMKQLDAALIKASIQKTGRVVTVQDHQALTGLAAQVNKLIAEEGLQTRIRHLAVEEYQLSGTWEQLYKAAGIGVEDIKRACLGEG